MKKNLCIFIGYTSLTKESNYGTEISIIKLTSYLSKTYNVFIVTLSEDDTFITDSFVYVNYSNLCIDIDILIISRYINYFLYCSFKPCKQIYLWIHDTTAHSYYKGYAMENNGKAFLENCLDKIDKIIVLSDWHKSFFKLYYPYIPDSKLVIIGNGICCNDFCLEPLMNTDVIRRKNRFIWTSCLTRGIERCVEIMKQIYAVFPDTELYVFRDFDDKYQGFIDSVKDLSYIHFCGKISNQQIIEEFKKSEYWFYPTSFQETFCISALEAQMAGCIAIATNVASLNTTVGEHGYLIEDKLSNEEIGNKVIELMTNEKLKNELKDKGQKWAKEQDWSIITKKWLALINYKKFWFF